MASYRHERVAEQVHREVSMRLLSEVKDPRVTPISVTRVDVTKDLRRAVINYLPLGGNEPSDELVEALNDVAKHLRGPIGRALRLSFAPELVFKVDHHLDAAVRVTSIIEKLVHERKVAEAPADAPEGDEPADNDDSEAS